MKILVSQCLLGSACRWDGQPSAHLLSWFAQHGIPESEILALCPETLGELSTPRVPAEIIGGRANKVLLGHARIETMSGEDQTEAFLKGAHFVLQAVKDAGVRVALLKSKSPSCGVHQVYDGTFSRKLIPGKGLTAELLAQIGVTLFDEHELDALALFLATETKKQA